METKAFIKRNRGHLRTVVIVVVRRSRGADPGRRSGEKLVFEAWDLFGRGVKGERCRR